MSNVVEELRVRTYEDLMSKLVKYGKCALVRCTGFGKTYMVTDLFRDYSRVLYLYPADCVREVVDRYADDCSNVQFMTYVKLARLTSDDFKELKDSFDLIITDECHRIGAVKTREQLHKLINVNPRGNLVGLTATPDRMDMVDIVYEFFNNITVFPYTLHDAFKDGVIQRPYYCYCTYDIETDMKKEALRLEISEDEVKEVIASKLIEIAKLYNIPNIIKDVCKKHVKDTRYMKYIVFFKDTTHMDSNKEQVKQWFSEAFPKHSVNELIVRSDKKEYRENVGKLDDLTYRRGNIDLIMCIDMLNMGYHIDDITGIVMYRGTESGTIFVQQLGRALSSGTSEAAIVFDIVDNLHRKAMYSEIETLQKRKIAKVKKALRKRIEEESKAGGIVYTEEELDVLVERELKKQLNPDGTWNEQNWHHGANDYVVNDLIATGHAATYEELLAKAFAEQISMRCRAAYNEWIARGGNPEPRTWENWGNPDGNERVPLNPCCYIKNVSVQAVCRYYGIIK